MLRISSDLPWLYRTSIPATQVKGAATQKLKTAMARCSKSRRIENGGKLQHILSSGFWMLLDAMIFAYFRPFLRWRKQRHVFMCLLILELRSRIAMSNESKCPVSNDPFWMHHWGSSRDSRRINQEFVSANHLRPELDATLTWNLKLNHQSRLLLHTVDSFNHHWSNFRLWLPQLCKTPQICWIAKCHQI